MITAYYKFEDFTKESIEKMKLTKNEEYQWIAEDMNKIPYAKVYYGFDKFISFWNNWNLETFTLNQYWSLEKGLKPVDPNFSRLVIEPGKQQADFIGKDGQTYEQKWFHSKAAANDHIKLLKRWKTDYPNLSESAFNEILKKENPGVTIYTSTHNADNMILVVPEENWCVIWGINTFTYVVKDYFFNVKKLVM